MATPPRNTPPAKYGTRPVPSAKPTAPRAPIAPKPVPPREVPPEPEPIPQRSPSGTNGNGKREFVNYVELTVHLSAPEMKYTAAGAAWTKARAFVSMGKIKDSDEYKPALWLTIKAFTRDGDDSLPQALNAYEKGAIMTVSGRLAYEEWTTEEGETRGTLVVIAAALS